jgi:hypothetical protein
VLIRLGRADAHLGAGSAPDPAAVRTGCIPAPTGCSPANRPRPREESREQPPRGLHDWRHAHQPPHEAFAKPREVPRPQRPKRGLAWLEPRAGARRDGGTTTLRPGAACQRSKKAFWSFGAKLIPSQRPEVSSDLPASFISRTGTGSGRSGRLRGSSGSEPLPRNIRRRNSWRVSALRSASM